MTKIFLSTIVETSCPIGRALRDLGFEVRLLDPRQVQCPIDRYVYKPVNKFLWNLRLQPKSRALGQNSPYCAKNMRSRRMARIVEEFKPDGVYFQIGVKPSIRALRTIRKHCDRVGGWWTTTPKQLSMDPEEAPFYDAFCAFSEELTQKAAEMGFRASFVPNSINQYVFRPQRVIAEELARYSSDVVFVGGWSRPRQRVLEVLSTSDRKMDIFGLGWRRRNLFKSPLYGAIREREVYGEELVKRYRAAKIVLNVHSWFMDRDGVGLNQRVFDVPACGAFLLTDYANGLDSFYRIGEEIDVFRDPGEAADKVRYYLGHEDARRNIARKGYEKARRFPTLLDQARTMVRHLGLETP